MQISEDLGPAMVGLTMWVFFTHVRIFTYCVRSDDNLKGGKLANRGW